MARNIHQIDIFDPEESKIIKTIEGDSDTELLKKLLDYLNNECKLTLAKTIITNYD